MRLEILRLTLAAPLAYSKDENDPFIPPKNAVQNEERLYRLKIDPSQALEFEPDESLFIESMTFSGKAAGLPGENEKTGLPAGNYLFAQTEGRLPKEDIVNMAVELQKEGLWQRLVPSDCFYLRFLHEDGRDVTQVFRPYDE